MKYEKIDMPNIKDMSETNEKEAGFDFRIVDFRVLHNQKQEDFDAFVDIIDPKDGQVILDGMDGYGAAAKEILEFASQKGFKPEIYMLDESAVQIERARANVPNIDEKHIVRADMRSTPFDEKSFDTVVIKMGIHEVQKEEQQKIVTEAYRILKNNGKFVIWELAFLDQNTQSIFQNIIRRKDELAGFDKLVHNRYFPRRDELFSMFKNAGFEDISVAHKIDAKLSLRVRESELVSRERKQLLNERGEITPEEETLLTELGKHRCDVLVTFAKELMTNVSEEVKKQLHYQETADDIIFEPNKEIIVGRK